MLAPIALSLLVGLAAAAGPLRSNFEVFDAQSTNLDDPQYRLKDTVYPTDQYVHLDVYLNELRFDGFVSIDVTISEADLTQIVLHQNLVAITAVTVLNSNNEPVALAFPNSFELDNYFEIIKINLANPIPTGQYKVNIEFRGQIFENQFERGLYMGYYYLNGAKRIYATTQFQPFYARKVFPCFDEPQFKSRFVISITRDANLSPSYSNMAIAQTETLASGRVRETFLPTPIISVYIMAFHISDFIETDTTSTPAKPFKIISRPGVEDQHAYAADMGVKITQGMDDYFGIGYYDMGQGQPMKNDHIASPDFPAGAMENWGLVNYREAYLLKDANTNIINEHFIANILAHELAHKWFGNLVTCFWWSNLWLNESFATYFEFFAVHWVDPDLEMDDEYVVYHVQSGLANDAAAGATPMNWTGVVSTPTISSHFSATSYAKGGSVLRMMEHFVGETTFRDALRYYLRENAYQLGTPEDMYDAFRWAVSQDASFATDYPGIDVGAVFDTWVQNPGAPVLQVNYDVNAGSINLIQSRFQLTGTPSSPIWHIPITWTHGSAPVFNRKPTRVMTTASETIPAPTSHNWVLFNLHQSAHYRVNYDDHNWEMLAAALREDVNVIPKLSRSQIVNDVLYFMRAELNYITIERGFDVLSFLEFETDYYVWNGALGQLDWFRNRLRHLPALFELFDEYLLELLENVIQHLGYEESANDTPSTILNRMQIMNYACNLGHQGCIDDSLTKWNAFRTNQNNVVPVNARRYVYCTGIRNGNTDDYNFLFNVYNTSESAADMVVVLRTLACTRDESNLVHYLEQSLHNDRIRIHDRTNAFAFALQGNNENIPTVLNFLFQNFVEIREAYGGAARLNVAINNLATFLTDFNHISQVQDWAFQNQIALADSFSTARNVVEAARNNLVWANERALDIHGYIRGRSSASVATTSVLVMLVAMMAHILH